MLTAFVIAAFGFALAVYYVAHRPTTWGELERWPDTLCVSCDQPIEGVSACEDEIVCARCWDEITALREGE